jgi:branched-chain amino acid transport system ATP-binding protein
VPPDTPNGPAAEGKAAETEVTQTGSGGQPILELKALRVFRGGAEALKGVSLSAERGEITALTGPSGSGKTAALRAVVGLDPPAVGEIIFEGRSILGRSPESLVGDGLILAPEGRRVFPLLTVRENLWLGAHLRRGKAAIKEDLDWALSLFPDLAPLLGRRGGALSAEAQQKLSIARALMGRPKLLLLDEPALGLGAAAAQGICEAIREISAARGASVLLAARSAGLALKSSKRACVLSAGRVAASGLSEALLANDSVRRICLGV